MRLFALLLMTLGLGLASALWAAPATLIDTDFGTATKAVNDVSADGKKSLTGVLPAGWVENSGWQKEIVVRYDLLSEEGRKFVRVTKVSGGGQQLAFYLKDIPEETFYHLEVTARSSGSAAVTLGLRDGGPPYSFHWSASPGLLGQWQNLSYDFRVDRQAGQVGLWINLGSNGAFDLASVRLVARNRADIIAELQAKYPAATQKNLVTNSRFPLGLPTGWALDRDNSDGDEVQVSADAKVLGPSQAPTMRVAAPGKWKLWSAPFALPRSFEPHTVSLYLKGAGKGRLVVLGDGRETGWKDFTLQGDQFQRVAVTFNPVLMASTHQLRIEFEGQLWLDALQAEPGKEAGPYQSQYPCEAVLTMADSDASAARVVFTDEPVVVRYAVTGAAPGAELHCKLINVYGQTKTLPVIKLAEGFLRAGTIKVTIPADRPLGAFRLEGLVTNAAGATLSGGSEVVFCHLPRPKYWGKPAPNSPFGVHTNSTTRHILMAKAVGANWTRLHDAGTQYIGWAHLEPEPGKWTFYDTELKRYGRYGMEILGLLSTAPLWANYQGTPRNGYFDRYVEPKDLSQFANYVKVVTTRYKGLIHAYDVWNEPWGTSFWSMGWDPEKKQFLRSPTASEDYYKLQKITYETAMQVDPKLTILGFNTYGGYNGQEWTTDLLKYGGLDACNAVCYHHYSSAQSGYPGDDEATAYEAAWKPILEARKQIGKPVWMTEGTSTSDLINNGMYHYTLPGVPQDDNFMVSNRLCRYVISQLGEGVAKVFLYTMHGHGAFTGRAAPWRSLVEDDGYLHPSAAAHAAMATQLEDTHFVQLVTLAPGAYAYLFQGDKRAVAVLSTGPGYGKYILPKSRELKFVDLFGNPTPAGEALGQYLVYASASGTVAALEKALKR